MLLWPPLTGNQLSPMAPLSWVIPIGHIPVNRHDQQAKSREVPVDTDLNLWIRRKDSKKIFKNSTVLSDSLNIAGNIFARILLNHMNAHLEQQLLLESECGFQQHRGTTEIIFDIRHLQEKCQEMRTHLHATFVDLKKVFNLVNRNGLWNVMQKFSCPERFTHLVRQL
ncbi:unnamed protein product [Schistocephalus solidus]|uniref:Reverse transcriptase domain-containing protein n=1 Tax=Schistocephalus solidus TaxID=70667 RepID=A0A183T5P3_SCHSO|nr:unnamed protein product [Schistocephalus solidus]